MLRSTLPRCLLLLVISCSCVYAQDADKPVPPEAQGMVKVVLAGSGPMVVDEVTESTDGYWYRRGNVSTFLDRAKVVRIEYPKLESDSAPPTERSEPNARWRLADAGKVKDFFMARFNRPLPLSAFGQSD